MQTAKAHNIATTTGAPNKGLAYQIAVNGFEPTEHETLIRIGMPCACDQCKKQKRLIKRAHTITLFDMSSDELLCALKNRQPMKSTHTQASMNDFIRTCKSASKARKVTA
jgi:hypothetical protein